MKKIQILLLTLLIPFLGFTQNDSWVRFQVQFDFYAPAESNFFMVSDSTLDSTFFYQPTQPYEYLDTIINLVSGDYTISLTDNFGDGWISQQPAFFKMKNICQGLIINWDPVLGSFFQRDTTVNILPCAPPAFGCTNPFALNYDSLALVDDGSCIFPPCGGFLTSGASQQCLPGGQTLVSFNWTTDTTNINCDIVRFWYSNADGVGPFQYGLGPDATDFAVYAGNGQMPPNWSVEHYGIVEFADGSLSDTIAFTPTSCIAGCTDPTQPTYNPWATYDDGSCSGTTCDYTEYQITMEITFDNWPNETSWIMNSGGIIDSAIVGTYNFNDVGQTYTYTFCIDQTIGFEFILSDSYGDGMAGSTSGGSMDGMVVIYDCNGDTIWHMDNPGFGYTLYSGALNGVPCNTYADVFGCTDDDYQEYDPLATIDDSTCVNLHIYGCTDSSAFNYDPNATILDLVPDCQYQLWIGDAGGDGWGNSYIGVYQNGINFGTFTMGPGSYQDTFLLTLDAGVPVQVYYFEVGGPQQPPEEVQFQTWHNSFKLTNAYGVVLLHEGQNPFANNGQGALQSFTAPFWTIYSAIPYCGDSCIAGILGCMDSLSFNYDVTANMDDGSCIPVVLGCTNSLAFNYDSLANTDDGSCVAEVIGCMDSTAFNFNPSANTNDPASCIPVILGCMDDTQFNYNAAANTDDGSCVPYIFGCTDPLAFNYDPLANTNNFSCIPVLLGCTDPTAFNFNVNANTDDGTCVPIVIGCTDATALNYDSTANVNFGCTYPILGCTDPTAFNYNSLANVDDGSCLPIIYGCTDSTAWNYDPLANTNIGCIPFYYGCTDPTQFNYDPLANTDDGSCVPFILGCNDPTALNYDSTANVNTGCVYPVYGCTNPTAFNYDVNANVDDSSCVPYIYGCTDSTATNFNSLANTNVGCIYPILGCTDPNAFNFNINANTDDGSCIPVVIGCTDATALNYDSIANVNNGCVYPILGCTNPTQFNYDPLANTDDGSCVPYIYGCTDNTMFNYAPFANTENGSCIPFVYGCTDSTAFNYDPLANTDNNTCIIYVYGCTNPTAINYNPLANTDDGSCINPIYGCTDSTMFNYNPLANTDNGTCQPFVYGCTNPNALNYSQSANTDDGSCITPIYGCMDSTQFNYNPLANVDNGSCEPFVYGCNDATAFNYDPLANTSDNTCCYISGCTDPTALNYNTAACFDDGSCVTIITGCTDVAAYNFDPTANVSDSTACLYDAGCYGGPGIPYWLNDGCYAWVIDVDEYCCTNDWDVNCIQLYDYCQQGMPTNINELLRENNVMIYPNPTRNIVNLEYKKDARVDLYGPLGELIISGDNIKQIDLSEYSNGIYVLYMTYNNKTITHKIIKQ
tara:strand:- start:1975 stop:6060 length:4086 start_codon:yes stop_codon:yes gene_type:complete